MSGTLPTGRPRDLRLDFFRGLGMFIIFIAHVPNNAWNNWIPARFGASDATEIFVFCSGMASALAFGAVFRDRSALLGAARTAHRVWQVYWAHIGLFCIVVAMIAWFDTLVGSDFYTTRLYVRPFLEDPASHLIGLMTLRYVPNYFDILPMYLVLLAMMPIIATLGLANRWLAFALMAGLWLVAQADYLSLSAEVRAGVEREWFFNPFGWQLVFFTGFAFMMGWIKAPPIKRSLVVLAVAILLLNVLFASRFGWENFDFVYQTRDLAMWTFEKTDFGLMRYVHFLALAYLAYVAAGEGGRRLAGAGAWGAFVRTVRRVGQQSLAVFLSSMVLAQIVGALLDVTGRTPLTIAFFNLAGFATLVVVATTVAWFKHQPWRRPHQPAAGAAKVERASGVERLTLEPAR
ncbi:OpgC domain-containing protein [Acuticoccus sp. 2012]|uniref:OpgC domain-containing protein n=2 Tax=Acuticoccus mangrovi TaxID=2796142 RepID=A0A934IEI4_9HYPH|nr:OpgC domain-containing protein [Acuticoccus mangrovi]MBJ3775068.1 OpgC domain-containing protein [Acuticoccus mangrovi]